MKGTGKYQTKPDARVDFHFTDVKDTSDPQGLASMRLILIGDMLYMDMGEEMEPGKTWLKMSLRETGKAVGIPVDELLDQMKDNDPREQAKALLASKDVREMGTEQIGGVETTHYAGTLTADQLASAPNLSDSARKSLDEMFELAGVTEASFDVWVDSDFQICKLVETVGVGSKQVLVTVDDMQYGGAVDITPPPADQVADFNELLKELEG